MSVLPEVRRELVATAARHASALDVSGQRLGRPRWLRSKMTAPVGLALSSAVAVAVVVVAVLAVGHRPAGTPATSTPSSLAALQRRLAVLRRPQTAADHGYPGNATRQNGRILRLVKPLTRLAAVVDTPTAGQLRVYLIVRRLQPGAPVAPQLRPGSYAVDAVAVGPRGESEDTALQSAAALDTPNIVSSGLSLRPYGIDPNAGITVGVVPDGVTRVRWVFTGAGYGITHPRPVTIYPQVHNNVAVAPVTTGEGPLRTATWYGASGRLIATAGGGADAAQRLRTIAAVNASRSRPIAAFLLAHFSLFRSIPADDPARDWKLPTFGTNGGYEGQLRLNYWQTRYVPSGTGFDGRGLWITPGSNGLCINDPQAGTCGMLNGRNDTWFIGGGTVGASGRQTISGLVPDGNPTVTLMRAGGARRTVPVLDHNVLEATVPGQVVAIIDRDAFGRVSRHQLR